MHKFTRLVMVIGLTLASIFIAPPADALFDHTWVASTGSDSANCDRPTPCATFAIALAQTFAGGEITCVDSGNFGAADITKSVTINCEGAIGSIVSATGLSQFIINTAATDVVVLRGLDLDGAHFASPPATINGLIVFNGAGTLHVQKAKINHFTVNNSGILFKPSGAGRLYVSESYITENGTGGSTTDGGIFIQPTGSGFARAVIERTVVASNNLGIVVDGSSSTGRTVVEINDSVVAGNALNGITVNQAGMVINRTAVQGNAGNGILAGPNALIHIGTSTVAANALGGFAYNGGQILSYGDNKTKGNGVDNAPSGVLTLN